MAILASIEVEDDGTLKIKNFRDALSDLEGQARSSGNAMDDLGQKGDHTKSVFGELNAQAAIVAAGFGLIGAAAFSLIREAADLAGRVQVLNTAIVAVAKSTNNTSFELQQVSKTIQALGITAREADNAVIQFAVANLKLADAVKLSRVAQDLAVVAGRNSSETFGLLIRSIQQTNVRLLDLAGIVTTQQRIQEKWEKQTQRNVSTMTSLELQQAILNEILEQGATRAGAYTAAMEDAQKQIGSFARIQEDAKVALGQAFLPVMLMVIKALNTLTEAFSKASPETQRLASAFLTMLGTMAALGAAIKASALLQLPAIFGALLTPMGLVVTGIGALTAAFIYLTAENKNFLEEHIQTAAALENQKQELDKAAASIERLGDKTKLSKEEQQEWNAAAGVISKLAPEAVSGIDSITGAYKINEEQLKKNREELEKTLEAELHMARVDFSRQLEKVQAAQKAVNEATVEYNNLVKQGATGEQATALERYNQFLMDAEGSLDGFNQVQRSANIALEEASVKLRKAIQDQKEAEATLKKYKQLIAETDPLERERIRLQREEQEMRKAAAEAAATRAAEAKTNAERMAKIAADEMDRIKGISDNEQIRFKALDTALKQAGRGTEEYNRLLLQNQGIIEKVAEANKKSVEGLNELTHAAERLKAAKLAVELEKWAQQAQKAGEELSRRGLELVRDFTDDAAKIVHEFSREVKQIVQDTERDLLEQDKDLRDKRLQGKQTEVDALIHENNRYYEDLIDRNNQQIKALELLKSEELKRINDLARARKAEIDDIVDKARIRFEIESLTAQKIDQLKKALAAGDIKRAEEVQREFLNGLNQMAADQKAFIDASAEAARQGVQEQIAIIDDQIAIYREQNEKIKQQNKETNEEIVLQHSTTYKILAGIVNTFTSGVINSIMGIIDGTKDFKDLFLDIFESIKQTMFQIVNDIVTEWVKKLLTIGPQVQSGGGFTPGSGGVGDQGPPAIGGAIGRGTAGIIGGLAGIGAAIGGGSAGSQFGSVGMAGAMTGAAAAMTGASLASAAALGVMTAGIGAAVVGVGLLIRKWTGVSEEVKQARANLEDFHSDIADLATEEMKADAAGRDWALTLHVVTKAYQDTGRTAEEANQIVAQLLDTNRPEASAAAMQKINDVLKEQAKIQAELLKHQEEANGLMEELFAAVEESGVGLPDTIGNLVNKMIELGLVTEDAAAEFHALQGENEVDWEKMADAAEKYGISIDALGPRFQQQRLGETAQEIWRDFQLLTKGGADVGTVLHGMREEISALVQESIQFGTSIPENFRPLVMELARTGQLLDENGNRIEDLSRIQFGDPIVNALDNIAAKMEDLIERVLKATGVFEDDLTEAAGNAEGSVDRINHAMGQLANDARGHADEVIAALEDIESAAEGAAVGHSPGGVREISTQFGIAEEAAKSFAATATAQLNLVETSLETPNGGFQRLGSSIDLIGQKLGDLRQTAGDSFDGFKQPADAAESSIVDISVILDAINRRMKEFDGSNIFDGMTPPPEMGDRFRVLLRTMEEMKSVDLGDTGLDAITEQFQKARAAADDFSTSAIERFSRLKDGVIGSVQQLDAPLEKLSDKYQQLKSDLTEAMDAGDTSRAEEIMARLEEAIADAARRAESLQSASDEALQNGVIDKSAEATESVDTVRDAFDTLSNHTYDFKDAATESLEGGVVDSSDGAVDAMRSVMDMFDRAADRAEAFRDTAVNALNAVEEAANGAATGHSPGGVREISTQFEAAAIAAEEFARSATEDLHGFEQELSNMTLGSRSNSSRDGRESDSSTEEEMIRILAEIRDLAEDGNGTGGEKRLNLTVNLHTPLANAQTIREVVYAEVGPTILEWLNGNQDQSRTRARKILGIEQ